MLAEIIKELNPKLKNIVQQYGEELAKVHTGRASAALVNDIIVEHYNSRVPLKQLATITVPSPDQIVISPWDSGTLTSIQNAVENSDLQLKPTNDGGALRLFLPPMNEERRKELTKLVSKKAENAKITARTLREDAWKRIQNAEKKKLITQDDKYRGEEELNKLIAKTNEEIDSLARQKEDEIMTI